MARSFDVVDAVPVKTDEGGESHRARHGTDKCLCVASRRKYVPHGRYHPSASAQNNAGPGITRHAHSAICPQLPDPPDLNSGFSGCRFAAGEEHGELLNDEAVVF